MRNNSYYFLNLGCPKNQVDGDKFRGALQSLGFAESDSPSDVDFIIVNTCAFIEQARLETIGEIAELSEFKDNGTRLVAVGCYPVLHDMKKEIPSVDATFRFNQLDDFIQYIAPDSKACFDNNSVRRIVGEMPYAYLVLSDGCDNRCSYCSIPSIRGKYYSRPVDDILREAEYLALNGVKELVLVAQDTMVYGQDIKSGIDIVSLCDRLAEVDEIEWLRIMYAHPAHLDEVLLDRLFSNSKVCHYLDMPVQHISRLILDSMRRHHGPEQVRKLINHLRNIDKNISLRTTLMVGFPGETDDDFRQLLEFVEEAQFDYLGAFIYSSEENTKAATLPSAVDSELARERYELLYEIAENISLEKAGEQVGSKQQLLVEGIALDDDSYYEARSYRQAPEIDGFYKIKRDPDLGKGQFVEASITDIDTAERIED